jgi:hypothetical protein
MSDFAVYVSGETVDVVITDERGNTAVTVSHVQSAAGNLYGLGDVDVTGLQDGSLLVYDSGVSKWKAATALRETLVDGGNF